MSELKQYTYAEVSKSNDGAKTIIAIHDKVFDVTVFLNEHPGGEEILLDHGGKDATEDFNDVGHSKDALELMNKYQVGEIVAGERRNLPKKGGWTASASSMNPEKDKYVSGPGTPFYLFAGAVVLAILAVYYIGM